MLPDVMDSENSIKALEERLALLDSDRAKLILELNTLRNAEVLNSPSKKLELDHRKIEDAALAILYFGHDQQTGRSWKNIDWGIMDGLFERGLISDPKNKNKTVGFTDEGLKLAEKSLRELFSK
jgi:hypothetical protein